MSDAHGGRHSDEGAPQPGTAHSWTELLDDLSSEVDELARRYVGRVKLIPGYEAAAYIPDRELHDTALECIDMLVECLRVGEPTRRLTGIAEEVGRRRARQSVPSEALATAVQLNFGVIWGRLLELCGPREAVTLAAHVEPTWRINDHFAAQVIASYTRETAVVTQERLNVRQSIVGRLFGTAQRSEAVARNVAFQLDCDPDGTFEVVVADQAVDQETLHRLDARLRRLPYFVHRTAGLTVAFWPAALASDELRRSISGLRCAHDADVRGMASIPAAARALSSVLEATDPLVRRVIDLHTGLPLLARRALLNDQVDVRRMLEDRFAECDEAERERIRDTVVAYLSTGSTQAAATRLFCHRNTVLNRIARFTALTGLDLTIPADSAIAVLAWSVVPPSDDSDRRRGG
ncbi:helix-turn-helix domain-containing protein [Microbacterium betulae]|uniref:Helix-turn-helix domain-containing protein n=1 Tax=Microbacterium betulae TaxID=2981139 RepID=A0AA97FIM3_9MICO|nr:helix-turn-helix domain-containing protein [Microbacterium sp. AB]WOF22719.1 helix-turn-helix domain-containing protein [Microbacterium sp. AB]